MLSLGGSTHLRRGIHGTDGTTDQEVNCYCSFTGKVCMWAMVKEADLFFLCVCMCVCTCPGVEESCPALV